MHARWQNSTGTNATRSRYSSARGECLLGLYLQLLLEVAHQKATSEKYHGGYREKDGSQHTLNLERQRPERISPVREEGSPN